MEDDRAFAAVDDDLVAALHLIEKAADAEHRRQVERARHDRGVALGAAEHGGESGDAARIHQRGIGRRQLLGEDHRAFGQRLDRGVRRLGEIAHQARADDADIVDPRREIGIAHLGEARRDLRDLVHHRALGIDALGLDPPLGAAHEARIAEHVKMRVEQIADLFLRRARQGVGLGFQLAQLLGRERDGGGEALELGLDLVLVETVFGNGDIVVGDEDRTDRDAGRDAEAFEPPLGFHRLRTRRSRRRSGPRERRPRAARRDRWRRARSRCPARRRASSAP